MPSLPKGGGALRGIGEKFSANPVTGTGSLSIPIATSPGRAGFHPDLSLSYDSGAGNGPFGHGFHLSVPKVTRKTDKGLPRYDDDADIFILSGAEDLVPVEATFPSGNDMVQRYRPRVEGLFALVERRRTTDGNVYWVAVTRDNVKSIYGRSPQARIFDPEHPWRIFSWLLEETRDDRGNVILYKYKEEDLVNVPRVACSEANRYRALAPIVHRYLKRIRYGNTIPFDATPALDSALFEVVFDYGEHDLTTPTVDDPQPQTWPCRQDPFSTYRAGFEIRTYRLCRRVLMFHSMTELGDAPCLVRSTDFSYTENPVLTQLASVTHTGYIRDPATLAYQKKSHPPVEFGYSLPQIQTRIEGIDRQSLADLRGGVQGLTHQWVDLDGEGLPGVLIQEASTLFYKKNLGEGKLAPARRLPTRPSLASSGGLQLLDLDGDGRKEMVVFEPPVAGYHERTEEDGWAPFRTFASQPNINWSDPNLRFIDLSGDGHEDVLIARDQTFLWYPSLAKGGFGKPITLHKLRDEEKGPALVFADGTQTLFLADMTGDGLTDLVRIRNGSVCYWPNLGYGRFGAKVQMDGEVWFDNRDQFEPRRLRLADVDGSGTTDILYIHRDGVRIYTNQSGNTLAAPIQLPRFPDQSDLSTLSVLDLLGTGTGCLVWSSSLPRSTPGSIRYVDLLGSKKPYLLISVKNNLGLETRMEYAPSTKFYLEDALAGRPWGTRLPFPVQVLTRVETYDAVSRHRFVSTYAYHHGYFDGVEREFRGFGMVEQWDTEAFSAFSGMGELPLPANATDPELHLPPVHTKTWFHTGAWMAAGKLAQQYAHEYDQGDAKAALLPDTILPSGLTADEAREACRALKGQILRQETYADDGSAQAPHPYVVSERSYEIRPLQLIRGKAHGIFFVHPREAIEYHYERNPDDPRITHAFTLEVDAFGTVRRSVAVGYPRRAVHAVYEEQTKVAITLTEADVFHHAPEIVSDWYRLGVPLETRTYELTGLVPAPDALFSFKSVLDAADEASAQNNPPLPHEGTPDPAKKRQKRLISQARTLYARDDLSGPLPFGQVESLALPWQSYAKTFTSALIADVFQGRATDAILAEGGYVKLDGHDAWWIPSGRQIPASAAFYLPVTFLDPFGNATNVAYDPIYHLFVTQVSDPVGNVVSASYDHRVLTPIQVTDPNGNRAQARFDALGRVVATALMGKDGSNDGDLLADPTTTFDYDLDRYRQTGKPNVVHARAREQHGAANIRWQESYSYADGSGHEVMRKVQAEPGPASQRDATGALVHDAQGKLVVTETKPRWVGTGRTVFDNKGNPVKQYEPSFSATAEYEDEAELVEWGVTPILHYDPLGRLIRTDLPNGTFSKVVFDPWQETRFDPNDTVLESAWYQDRQGLDPIHDPEGRAAHLAAAHANTPAVVHLDALGRTFRTVEDNGPAGQYATTVTLDIEGNPLTTTDARGVVAMQHRFGMGGHKLWQKNCDAGERWTLADVGGALLRAWDGHGFARRAVYDETRRPTHLYVQAESGPELLVERTIYGEALGLAAAISNHRGRVYQHYDGAGVVTSAGYDFKGNLLESDRRLAKEYHTQVDWKAIEGLAVPDVLASPTKDLLDAESFRASTAYDALNRPTSLITPDRSEIVPTYNEASLLDKVQVRIRGAAAWTTFVDDIDYDAKGQRESIVYGGVLDSNGVLGKRTTTVYTYDPLTFCLVRLNTTREVDGELLQSLSYTYDPVGNITEIKDSAQQKVFFANDVILPKMAYVYDAIYRLIQGSGREQAGGLADVQRDQNDLPVMNLPHVNDMQAVRNYTETYEYDPVGNILRMAHDSGAAATSWTRRYDVDANSNRLLGTSMPGDPAGQFSANYTYDAHGNMISMPHLLSIWWDYRDQMVSADKGGGGVVYFTYDTAGQRVRKVWEHNGLVEERIYLGGWEVYRKYQAADKTKPVFERETLHVMDGVRRIALVETTTADADQGGTFQATTVTRVQMGNHLGSAVLEMDESGRVISYAEYHPYGTTAYLSGAGAAEVSWKRYRYTGKERDLETGLYYYGARYYAPWLGRWTSADPAGIEADGPGLYTYARDNPIGRTDPTGRQSNQIVQIDENTIAHFGTGDVAHRGEGYIERYNPSADDRQVVVFADDPITAKPAAPAKRSGPPIELTRELEKYKDIPDASIDESVGLPPELTPAATTAEAVGAFAKGAAEGLATGILVDAAIGVGASLAGVSVGVAAATVGVVLLPFAIYGIASHWDEITAGVNRLVHGTGTAKDYEAAGGVVGGLLSIGASGPASEVGAELGQAIRMEATDAVASLGPKLAHAGPALDGLEGAGALESRGSGSGGGVRNKPGKLGQFKGTDALRAENKVANDAAREAGLTKDQRQLLHREIGGQGLTYQEIIEIAKAIATGEIH